MPDALQTAQAWLRQVMLDLRWSQGEVAKRARDAAQTVGVDLKLTQQAVAHFLSSEAKRVPAWLRDVSHAVDLERGDQHQSLSKDNVAQQLMGYRAGPTPDLTPAFSSDHLRAVLPIIFREAIGFDRGPAISRVADMLGKLVIEARNHPSLLRDKDALQDCARQVAMSASG